MTQPARRRFPGRHDQVSCARAFVRDVLGGCPQLDEAVLLTSELCTNALQHTHSGDGGTFEVTVYHRPGSLRVEVRDDGSPSGPVLGTADSCSEDGRGLEIVACLAHRWGQRGDEYGRCVYFELRWTNAAIAQIPRQTSPGGTHPMRISPSSYHTVPRTLGRRAAESSCPGPTGDHEITPECASGCLKAVIPAREFRALANALTGRWPSRVLTVADVLALYRTGELAVLPGVGRRSYAGIQNGLYTAGLITRQDAPGRRSDAAAQGTCARGDAAAGLGGS